MKLGFIGDNDLKGVEEDSRFAKENGFAGLEYNWWGDFRDVKADQIRQMRAIHEKHGVKASMLGIGGWNHLSLKSSEREEAHTMLNRAIDYAKVINADVLVTGAGDIPGEPTGRKVNEFLKVFPPFMDKIRAAGLKVAFYAVHGASFFDSIEAYERVWEQIPDISIKFDPANWLHHGDDYLAVARRYGHKIGHVHIKEHLYVDKQLVSQPAAGMGDIQWGKLFAFLYEHDYRNWLSIEPHGDKWGRGELRKRMLLLTKKYVSQFML